MMHGTTIPYSAMRNPLKQRSVPANMADRLIVALDVDNPEKAKQIVRHLDGVVSFFKIGLWLLFAEGTDKLIDWIIEEKKDVFLDYKMFDIGETVQRGVERARDRGIKFVTVHGDGDIIQHAVAGKGDSNLKIFTITVLTSLNDQDLEEMGYKWNVRELIKHRVRYALQYGSDGIIAAPSDNPNEIRELVNNQGLLIATPGVRPSGHSADDHARTSTPVEAIRDGADYIILGRPILNAADPRKQALQVIAEMEEGERQASQS